MFFQYLYIVYDELKYEWYYKDADMPDFIKAEEFEENTYTTVMSAHNHLKQLYCLVTDEYGISKKTDTVTLSTKLPETEMLAWADEVVSAHPDHRVVVITHGYFYHDGTTLDRLDAYSASRYPLKDRKPEQEEKPSLDGDQIWEQFVSKHENIQLVLSGHDPSQHVVYGQDKGENGNTVTQMLIDPQGIDGFYELTGMVAMFYFSNNGNTLTVRYYSVEKDLYGSESSQFTIDLS